MKRSSTIGFAMAAVLQATSMVGLAVWALGSQNASERTALLAWANQVTKESPCKTERSKLWPLAASSELSRVQAVAIRCDEGMRVLAWRTSQQFQADDVLLKPVLAHKSLMVGSTELHYFLTEDSAGSWFTLAAALSLGLWTSVTSLFFLRRDRQATQLLASAELRLAEHRGAWVHEKNRSPMPRSFVDACRHNLALVEDLLKQESIRQFLCRLHLRRVCDQVGMGMVVYDGEGRIRAINRHARKLLGIAQLARHPKHMSSLLSHDDTATTRRLLDQVKRTGSHAMAGRQFRRRLKMTSGESLLVLATEHLVGTRSRPRMLLTFEDRTAAELTESTLQLAIQEARTASEMKSRFLAMISHEIRTPLNGIIGLTDLLNRESPARHQIENLALLQESTRHLRSLLTDILDFSKIESGQMQLETNAFCLRTLIESTCNSLHGSVIAKGVHFHTDLQMNVEWVNGDSTRLRQVITNLIDNAIKFTNEGEISVTCRTTVSGADKGLCDVSVSVTDTGIGMATETVKKLFSPFTQANLSITRTFGGTGLGLSLCRLLCRRMDGDIMASSTFGKGSTFTFHVRLPIAEAAPLRKMDGDARHDSSTVADNGLQGKTILVADDNSLNRRILKRWLDIRGADVQLAEDGEEALHAVMADHFDAVLMDISMPNMDGIVATQKIREYELLNNKKAVAIIGVTALSTPDDHAAGSSAGMNACISKPVDRATLMPVLDRLIGMTRKQAQQENT